MAILSLSGLNKIILFGGGDRLTECCSLAVPQFDLLVVSSTRHLEERLESGITLRDFLLQRTIRFLDCQDPEVPEVMLEIDPNTLGISLGAPWIFHEAFIRHFQGRLLNLHSTRLPHYRGGGGYSWMIMMQDRRGAGLLHQVSDLVDAGPILLSKEYIFPEEVRIPADYFRYAEIKDLELLRELFACCLEGRTLETRPQDEAAATYFPRLYTKVHGFVDWTWQALEIEAFVSAFDDPYEGASTYLGQQLVYLKKCRVAEKQTFHPFQAGLVYRAHNREIFIAARGGGLVLEQVLNAEGRDMTASLRPGVRFHTPESRLDQARESRAIYTPQGMKIKALKS